VVALDHDGRDFQQFSLRRLERGGSDRQHDNLPAGILIEEEAKGRVGQMASVEAFT
jgi:hypothetical protein